MTTSFTPKSTTTKIPEISINSRIVTQPGIHYTCPTGKKAIATLNVVCTSLGAAGQVNLRDPTDMFNYASWLSVGGTTKLHALSVDIAMDVIFELSAGEQIKSTQDSGTNAEVNVVGKILELPA